jgi:ubiquinone/menaquinone biosynthesis C-methylase UbiE
MSTDPYAGFAERYDRFQAEFGHRDLAVVDFYRTLFADNGVRRVLDCACGTGRDLHLFHSLGCDVVGSDISESMLAQARKNLRQANVYVPFYRRDYRELTTFYGSEFDAVVCLSGSILQMPDEVEVARALKSMRGVLRSGGVLVLTQGTTDRQWREKPRFILAVNDADFSRLFVIDYRGRGALYNVVDLFHGAGRDEMKVWSIEYPHMLLRDDYDTLLREAGFESVVYYGGYKSEPYDAETSQRLIVIAR